MNEWDWQAKEANGQTHELAMVSGGDSDLHATTVASGNTVTGNVEFAVPDNFNGTIVYSAGGSERASWTYSA